MFGLIKALAEMAISGTKDVISVPKGTIKAIVWSASLITPSTFGVKFLKLNEVIDFSELNIGANFDTPYKLKKISEMVAQGAMVMDAPNLY